MNKAYSLQLESWLDRAQKIYLLDKTARKDLANKDMIKENSHLISIRQLKGVTNYYRDLELFMLNHPRIRIVNYRQVREGRVNVSRPSQLMIDGDTLLYYRPNLKLLKDEIRDWWKLLDEIQLENFVEQHYHDCIRDPALTRSCIQVFKFLLSRENDPWMLPRQLPHTESTKLVGKENLLLKLFIHWRKEDACWQDFFRRFRLLRRAPEFRIFAPHCHLQQASLRFYHGFISKDWYKDYDFQNLTQTLIVENRESFDALSRLSKNTLLLFGGGWQVSQLIDYQECLPRPIFYWGDIDKEGYEIFGYLADKIKELEPILMDLSLLKKYKHLSVPKTPYYGPFRKLKKLQDSYEKVCRSGQMLEQEKISLDELPISL